MNRPISLLLIAALSAACADSLDDPLVSDLRFDSGVAMPNPDTGQDPPPPRDVAVLTDAGIMDQGTAPAQDSALPDPMEPMDAALPPDPGVNAGWIGGPCARDEDCTYEGAFCLSDEEGYPRGQCSLDCDRFCPDRDGMPVTFCIGGVTADGGACVQRCDYDAFGARGCRPGYTCQTRMRFNESNVGRGVCVPGEPDIQGMSECLTELDQRGVNYDLLAPIEDTPSNAPHLRCRVIDPVRVQSPLNGVNFHTDGNPPSGVTAACELAVALHKMTQLLAELRVNAVMHMGTYNCRTIRNPAIDELIISQHGLATAIDISGLTQIDGVTYNVLRDWEHGVVTNWQLDESDRFTTPKGRFLYQFARELVIRGIANLVLTPEYNELHHNHFHVDLTPGSRGIANHTGADVCGH